MSKPGISYRNISSAETWVRKLNLNSNASDQTAKVSKLYETRVWTEFFTTTIKFYQFLQAQINIFRK